MTDENETQDNYGGQLERAIAAFRSAYYSHVPIITAQHQDDAIRDGVAVVLSIVNPQKRK